MNTGLTLSPLQQIKPDQAPQEQAEKAEKAGKAQELRSPAEHFPTSSGHSYLTSLKGIINDSSFGPEDLLGPDGHIRSDCHPPWGLTPLHIACIFENESLLEEALSDARFNVAIKDLTDIKLLSPTTMVSAPLDVLDRIDDCSPLHLALLSGWSDGALRLIDAYESQITELSCTPNRSGSTVLSLAAANCDHYVISSLCEYFQASTDYESFLHHTTPDGRNLLHHAAQQQKPAVYHHLREQMLRAYERNHAEGRKEASSHLTAESWRDRDGKTPIDVIRERVGASYMNRLDLDENLRYQKLHRNNWVDEWENYYVRQHHGDKISWVLPWEQCRIV